MRSLSKAALYRTSPGTMVAVPGPPCVRMKMEVKFWMVQIMLRIKISLIWPMTNGN